MLPEKILVAGINYDVRVIKDLAYNYDLGGQILYEKGLIKIDSGMSEDVKEQTLVHELLHAIFNEAGYDEQDEDMINRVGKVLYQVLKDNTFSFGDKERS